VSEREQSRQSTGTDAGDHLHARSPANVSRAVNRPGATMPVVTTYFLEAGEREQSRQSTETETATMPVVTTYTLEAGEREQSRQSTATAVSVHLPPRPRYM